VTGQDGGDAAGASRGRGAKPWKEGGRPWARARAHPACEGLPSRLLRAAAHAPALRLRAAARRRVPLVLTFSKPMPVPRPPLSLSTTVLDSSCGRPRGGDQGVSRHTSVKSEQQECTGLSFGRRLASVPPLSSCLMIIDSRPRFTSEEVSRNQQKGFAKYADTSLVRSAESFA
jgi:hypothetical protein